MDVSKPNRDMELLLPEFRSALEAVVSEVQAMGYPFHVYEGWRSGDRQEWLWESGRKRPGARITNARRGESYHEFGAAADVVLREGGRWSWSTAMARGKWWRELHAAARRHGLEPLVWELCHIQLAGTSLPELRRRRADEERVRGNR